MFVQIVELLETGKMARLESLMATPSVACVLAFSKIWGVGMASAQELYSAGFRSIEDLRARGTSRLNDRQRIGLKYYEDILDKIPR